MIVIPRRAPGAVHDPREKAMSKKRRTGTAEFHTQPLKRRISGILSESSLVLQIARNLGFWTERKKQTRFCVKKKALYTPIPWFSILNQY